MIEERRQLARRAGATRAALGLSLAVGAALGAYEVAAEFDLDPISYDSPAYDLVSALDGLASFVASLFFAFWTVSLVRAAARAAPGAPLPNAEGAGWVVFFFPVTLHWPYLAFRQVARAVRVPQAARLALWTYIVWASVVVAAVALYASGGAYPYVGTSRAHYAVVGAVFWAVAIAPTILQFMLVGRMSGAVLAEAVEDVFA